MLSALRKVLTRTPRTDAPQDFDLHADGMVLPVVAKAVPRAKRISLKVQVSTGKILLTFPPHVPFEKARRFAEDQVAWLAEKYRSLPQKTAFEDGMVFQLRGVPCRICATGTVRGIMKMRDHTDASSGGKHLVLEVPGDAAHCARKVLAFLKKEARQDLDKATRFYAAKIDVTVGRISIKDTRSRWGSCSARGDIAFSFRLIFAPPFVLDYVAAHEVAHRREMNHSDRYWALLNSMTPHVDAAERWLKQHGASLHRYG